MALVNWLGHAVRRAGAVAADGLLASASPPRRGRWWWCRPCSAAPPASRRWSRRSRCASSPTAIRNLHFGLLTDLHDAASEHLPGGRGAASSWPPRASRRSTPSTARPATRDGATAFFLFHRPRRWNARERVWMGHERKRGKLADLNALLRGQAGVGPGEAFARVVGDTAVRCPAVRYVITLDTDTQLPRDAAAQMVATMAHPLNRPRFGAGRQHDLVVDGYGILQPRVGVEPAEHEPLGVCAPVRRRAGHRSVHARRLRRLPGPVRRRLVHRQGHLRRRRLRARAGRPPAREPHPQPRPARRLLRALRPAQRRAADRGSARALRRRRGAPLPLDPRRLAAASAGCAVACARCRRRAAQPAVGAVAARRSSTTCGAAWCRPRCVSLLLAAWWLLPEPGWCDAASPSASRR